MEKIKMTTPIVEMDGDEMTRVLWGWIKQKLILPFVDLKTEYYDLGLLHRNETRDQVTVEAAKATQRLGVAVKCATITPNRQRMEEYPQLTEMWKSPNGTIRAYLDGTAFRAPILLSCIRPVVKNWEHPITIARHAYGDMYKAVDMATELSGKASTIQRRAFVPLPAAAFSTPSASGRTYGSPPRIPSPRSMTGSSSEFLKRNMRTPTGWNLKSWASPISTP